MQFSCLCVCHTHRFPRRQVSEWGGVQMHTEHKQFERLVIQTGVCSQTYRTFCVCPSTLFCRKARTLFVCIYFHTNSVLLRLLHLCYSTSVFLLVYVGWHKDPTRTQTRRPVKDSQTHQPGNIWSWNKFLNISCYQEFSFLISWIPTKK